MRRKLALFLSLVLLIGLLPARALAVDGDTVSDISNTGITIQADAGYNKPATASGVYQAGSGTLTWNSEERTVTLDSATINAGPGSACALGLSGTSDSEIKIVLIGENTLVGGTVSAGSSGISAQNYTLRFSGDGTLAVTGGAADTGISSGIECNQLVIEAGSKITALGGDGKRSYGVYPHTKLDIGGTLLASSGDATASSSGMDAPSSSGVYGKLASSSTTIETSILVRKGGRLEAGFTEEGPSSKNKYGIEWAGIGFFLTCEGTILAYGQSCAIGSSPKFENKIKCRIDTTGTGNSLQVADVTFASSAKYAEITPVVVKDPITANLFNVKNGTEPLDFSATTPAVLGAYKAAPYALSVERVGCTEDETGEVSLVITPSGGETTNAANEAKDAGDYTVAVKAAGGTKYAANSTALTLGTVRIEKAQVTLSGLDVPVVRVGSSTTTVDIDVSQAVVVDKGGKAIDGLTVSGTVTGTYASVNTEGDKVPVTVDVSQAGLSDNMNYELVAPTNVTGKVVGKKTLTAADFGFRTGENIIVYGTFVTPYFPLGVADTPELVSASFLEDVVVPPDAFMQEGPEEVHLTYAGSDGTTFVDKYPVNAGTYRLLLSVSETESYAAATDLEIGTLIIEPVPVYIYYIADESEELTQVYDGTTNVSADNIQSIKGALIVTRTDDGERIEGLSIDSSGASFRLASKNVGDVSVIVDGLKLKGDTRNYVLDSGAPVVWVEITPKPVTLTAAAPENLVYAPGMIEAGFADLSGCYLNPDGTVKNVTAAGIVSGDDVQIRLTAGAKIGVSNAEVGEEVDVTFNGLVLGGDDGKNYELSAQPASVKATIQKATIENLVEPQKLLSIEGHDPNSPLTDTYSFADLLPADDSQLASASVTFEAQTGGNLGEVTGAVADGALTLTFKEPAKDKNYKGTIKVSGLAYYNDFTVSLDYKLTDQAVAVATKAEYKAVYSGNPVAVATDGKTIDGLTMVLNPAEAKVATMSIVGTAPVLHVTDSDKASAFVIHVTFEGGTYAEMDIPVKAAISRAAAPAGLTIKAVPTEVKSFFDTQVELEITTPGIEGEEITLTTSTEKALTPAKSGSAYKATDTIRLTEVPGTDESGRPVEIAPVGYKVSWSHPDYEHTWKEVEVPVTKSVPVLLITPDGTDGYDGGTQITLTIDCASETDLKRMEVRVTAGSLTLTKVTDGKYTATLPNTTADYDFDIFAAGVPVNEDGTHIGISVTRVAAAPVESVAVSPATASVKAGETVTLIPTVTPSAAGHDILWSSSNTSVATVSANGVVTGVRAGTATITVTAGGKSASCTVTVTPGSGGDTPAVPSTPSGSDTPSSPTVSTDKNTEDGTTTTDTTAKPSATIKDGTASTTVNPGMGSEIVKQAEQNKSDNVVIAPEVKGDVSKTEVSIPAKTVEEIGNKTEASLTVSTPVADVVIPNEALGDLAKSGGSVNVTAERTGNTVELSVTAGGEAVSSVPGGLKVTVPAEEAKPGTVAVLVHEDGTREVIRKSVAVDDSVTIPLDGSAKIEIVDNSKSFPDVPATNWEADAVTFAAAHELFNGDEKGNFNPSQPMSRGMLAVVLHNMERNPAQALTGTFGDVDDSQWYAEGVAWAASKGIVGGYGNGQFGPNDPITREQLAVMLWRYAGSPTGASKDLEFNDSEKVSSYATDAMRWAVENGIINGKGGGILDPGGEATRAETAQMLKNFLEKQ